MNRKLITDGKKNNRKRDGEENFPSIMQRDVRLEVKLKLREVCDEVEAE